MSDNRGSIDAELVENHRDERALPRNCIAGAGCRRTAVAYQVNANDTMISRKLRSEIVPPVDCTAESMNKRDRGSRAFDLHVRWHNPIVNNLAAVTGRRRARLRVDPEGVGRERNEAEGDLQAPKRWLFSSLERFETATALAKLRILRPV
jgi:hypothetical protein